MQNSETGNATNGAKTADRRSLGFPGGVGGEGNPALYCKSVDTLSQGARNSFQRHQNAHNQKLAFSRLPKNCKHKSTKYLTEAQVADITLGAKTAHDIGRPLNMDVTIRIDPDDTVGRPQDIIADYLARLRRWLKLHGSNATYFWILEQPGSKTIHAHFLLHIPPALQNNTKDGFRSWQQRAWYRCGIQLNAEPGTLQSKPIGPEGYDVSQHEKRQTYFNMVRGALKYRCKAMTPDDQSRLADDIRAADLFRIDPIPQGTIRGRRYSLSMDIREAARTQLWLNGARADFKARTAPLITN